MSPLVLLLLVSNFSLWHNLTSKFPIFVEENCEKFLVVEKIYNSASFSYWVHRKLWSSNIDGLDASLGRHHWSNSWPAKRIISHDELLQGYARFQRNWLQNWTANWVGHVALICVNFEHDSFVDQRHVLSLMLLRIVGVHGVSHISRKQKRTVNCLEVLFLLAGFLANVVKNALSDLNGHIWISSLCRWRPNFFMIKQHNHVNFSMIFPFSRSFGMLD